MEIRVVTGELQRACGTVAHSLGRVGEIDGLMITGCPDGVTLQTRNDSMHIETTIPGMCTENGSVLLQGKLFIDLVRKMSGDTVLIRDNPDNKAQVTLTSGKMTVNMVKGNPQYFNTAESVNGKSATLRQCDLKKMIDRVRFSAGTDASRQILTGCLLEVTASQAKMVALDGFRLAMQIIEGETGLDASCKLAKTVIPAPVNAVLSAVLASDEEQQCTLTFSPKTLMVNLGDTTIYANVFNGEYIDYNRIIPKEFETDVMVSRKLMLDVLEKTILFRDAAINPVQISFRPDSIDIRTKASTADFHEEFSATCGGNGLDIAFNANFLIAVLRAISDDQILIRLNSPVSPCVILPNSSSDNFLYLILPVRM